MDKQPFFYLPAQVVEPSFTGTSKAGKQYSCVKVATADGMIYRAFCRAEDVFAPGEIIHLRVIFNNGVPNYNAFKLYDSVRSVYSQWFK